MPERRLPDGRIQIYEEPGTLGLRVPTLTPEQMWKVVENVRAERRSTTESPGTPEPENPSDEGCA